MSKGQIAGLWLLFIALVALGGAQGGRIGHLRESADFYKWIQAVATDLRTNPDAQRESAASPDALLLDKINVAAQPLLPAVEDSEAGDENLSEIVKVVRDGDNDRALWNVATSDTLAPLRQEFLAMARNDELLFAKGLDLSKVQDSGTNLFNLFFGFRKIAANFLWLQVDRYWHQGEMYKMVPLMRTCVSLDPNFIDAYLLGAWHLGYNATAKMPLTPHSLKQWNDRHQVCMGERERYYYFAVDFLRDGIRNNPRNYKLYFDLGFAIYSEKLADYENAVRYLSEAVRHPHERWVPRQLYIALEKNGQYAESLSGWRDYLARFPENEAAPRFIVRTEALSLEQRSDKLLQEAEAASDPTMAEQKRAESAEYWQRARALWDQLVAQGDPFANSRIMRREAMTLASEKRYLEAIAVLEHARWESPGEFFEEASDLIIKYKLAGNIPLSVSERKAVERDSMEEPCIGEPVAQG